MKVWITKYALTQGIRETEAERSSAHNDMIYPIDNRYEYYHGEGNEWHLDKESAIKKAEEIRDKKIKFVQKQLEKLKNMKFE